MNSTASEIALLEEEARRLGRRLTWFRALRAGVLAAAVLGSYGLCALSLSRLDTAELGQTRTRIAQLSQALGKDYRFEPVDDPLGYRAGVYNAEGHSVIMEVPPLAPPADEAARQQMQQELHEEWLHLYRLNNSAFQYQVELVFGRATYDLLDLDWLYLVPVLLLLFVLSNPYAHILRKKQHLLGVLAAERLQRAAPEEIPLSQRLLIAPDPARSQPWARHPGTYLRALYWLALALLAVPLYWMARFPGASLDTDTWLTALGISGYVGLAALYLAGTIHHVCRQLERQVEAVTGWQAPPTRMARLWARVTRWTQRQRARLRPGISLPAGSLLVLLSVYLPLTTDGCSVGTGADVLLGKRKWVSANFIEGIPGFDWATRGLYAAGVLLALVSLALVLVPVWRRRLQGSPRVRRGLWIAAGALSLYVLADYAWFVILLAGVGLAEFGLWEEDSLWVSLATLALVWVLYWLVPLALWIRYGLTENPQRHARWPDLRNKLVVHYLAALLAGLFMMAFALIDEPLWGLLTYFFGIHLLALSYLRLASGPDPPAVTTPLPERRELEPAGVR